MIGDCCVRAPLSGTADRTDVEMQQGLSGMTGWNTDWLPGTVQAASSGGEGRFGGVDQRGGWGGRGGLEGGRCGSASWVGLCEVGWGSVELGME